MYKEWTIKNLSKQNFKGFLLQVKPIQQVKGL
jgi:hypothetical protein